MRKVFIILFHVFCLLVLLLSITFVEASTNPEVIFDGIVQIYDYPGSVVRARIH